MEQIQQLYITMANLL